jgi:hypothetical protein
VRGAIGRLWRDEDDLILDWILVFEKGTSRPPGTRSTSPQLHRMRQRVGRNSVPGAIQVRVWKVAFSLAFSRSLG